MNHKELGFTSPLIMSGATTPLDYKASMEVIPSNHETIKANAPLNSKACMGYSIHVAAKSAAGFGDLKTKRRTSAPVYHCWRFFYACNAVLWQLCAGDLRVCRVVLRLSRFANLRTAATLNCLATIRGSSNSTIGAPQMKNHAQNPSITNRIAALKSRAISALHANSSLKVRLNRYNSAMQKARALESQGGAQ